MVHDATTRETATVESAETARKRIRVWFGSEVICSHVAEPDRAQRYAALMRQRFAGLRVTIDDRATDDQTLPHELLWERTIQ